jgi:hypothetical protein
MGGVKGVSKEGSDSGKGNGREKRERENNWRASNKPVW